MPEPDGTDGGSEPLPDVARNLGPDADAWLRAAREARENGRIADARGMLERAAGRFPASPAILHDAARASEAMRDWPSAERHWRAFLDLAPQMWWAHTGLANALREQGRPRDADAVLMDQFVRFDEEPWIFFEYALLADRR